MDKTELIVSRIEDLKESVDKRLESIDNNLAEHMRRTSLLETRMESTEESIIKLQEPSKARKYIISSLKIILTIVGSTLGAALGIFKLMNYLNQ